MKFVSVVCAILLFGGTLYAQTLSEQNLIDLKKAGVDNGILVQQIQADGISFPMDAATTIRLKNFGFSDEVLSALLKAGSKQLSPNTDDPLRHSGGNKLSTATPDPIKTLYSQGNFPELCDYLKSQLTSDPKNYRLRTILIGALLRIEQQGAALAELQTLRSASPDPASTPYVERASQLLSSWQKQQEGKKGLLAALQKYSYADADSAVDQLSASMVQKTILHMLIDSYAAKFDTALSRSLQLQSISFSDKQRIETLKDRITVSANNYKLLMTRIDLYTHSPVVISHCSTVGVGGASAFARELRQFSIADYADLVSKLSQLAPLSPQVLNLAFHATMLTSQYDNLQALGDKILAAQGAIRIPFYSRDRFFDVIIDTKLKSLYTQPDSHPFEVKYAISGMIWRQNVDHDDSLSPLVPFNLAFDQVRSISQNAGASAGTLKNHSVALSFEPNGVAPNYSLMALLLCTAGEEAELQATKNLGLFVMHVIGNPDIKTKLANPSKTSHSSGLGDAIVALYGATHGNTPIGATAMQLVTEDKARAEIAQEQQQKTWQGILAIDYSNDLDGEVFDSLDKLIEVTQ